MILHFLGFETGGIFTKKGKKIKEVGGLRRFWDLLKKFKNVVDKIFDMYYNLITLKPYLLRKEW